MLNINTRREDATLTVGLEGRLDTVTSPDLEKRLSEELPGVTSLVLDLEGLSYISSAGLRVLLSAQKIMNVQGTMKVTHVCDTIMEIFDVTGFSDILSLV